MEVIASIAQSAERQTMNSKLGGTTGTSPAMDSYFCFVLHLSFIIHNYIFSDF